MSTLTNVGIVCKELNYSWTPKQTTGTKLQLHSASSNIYSRLLVNLFATMEETLGSWQVNLRCNLFQRLEIEYKSID